MTRTAARGDECRIRVRVYELRLKLGPVNNYMAERGFIRGYKHWNQVVKDSRFPPSCTGRAFPANEVHEVPVTLVSGGRGTNPVLKAPVIIKSHSKL